MLSCVKAFIASKRAEKFSQRKIREAYLIRDSKFLRKAFKYGRNYSKRMAVNYLGEISTQKNFEFLLNAMKTVEDQKLKSYIYLVILPLLLNEKIKVTDNDSLYLNEHLHLLDDFDLEGETSTTSEPSPSPPINFRSMIKDHLEILEEMKRLFHP